MKACDGPSKVAYELPVGAQGNLIVAGQIPTARSLESPNERPEFGTIPQTPGTDFQVDNTVFVGCRAMARSAIAERRSRASGGKSDVYT